MSLRRRVMGQSGGVRKVEGTFTYDANNPVPTITHNFGTLKICAIVRPLNVKAWQGYTSFYNLFVNVRALLPDDERWLLDFTSYNTHFSDVVEVNPKTNANLREGTLYQAPWPTQNYWYQATNKIALYPGDNTITENTFKPYIGTYGEYAYTIFALE